MWTRFHRASSWRLAATPSLSTRPALQRRVFAPITTDSGLHNGVLSASGDAEKAPQSPVEDRVLSDQDRARVSVSLFSTVIRNAPSPAALTEMWSVLRRHEPVFVRGEGLQLASGEPSVPEDQALLRMVSMQEMLQLDKQGQCDAVVMRTLPPSEEGYADLPVSDDRVVLVSENFVTRKIVAALYRQKDFGELAQFVETVAATRSLEASQIKAAGELEDNYNGMLAELAELDDHNDRLYVAALGQLKAYTKIVDHVAPRASDLSRYIMQRDAFSSLLDACVKTREGSLARTAIDQIMDGFPLLTFNARTYTAALHANLRAKPKTLERLENAMHIYRRMFHEAGYILAPQEWSLLFNSCIYLDQPHLAIEIFKDYRAHGIAPFQQRFEQALRTACRFQKFDTAIEMARLWTETEANSPPALTTLPEERLRMDEAECLNKILWEMLKKTPTLDQVEQVLLMMEPREVQAGALIVRRIVSRFLSSKDGEEEQTPEEIVSRFFNLWESCPQVIQRTGFVLHLVLEACSEREWNDQCARVIQYAHRANIDLPIGSTTKIMEYHAAKGEFDEAIKLGELVLEPRLRALHKSTRPQSRQRIPDEFFESLLTCYVLRQRFEDVARVGEAFQLGERRGEANFKLAAILRDAKSMIGYD